MRTIRKGAEPAELRAYRSVPGATYDGGDFTPVKDALRTALCRDQGALCCYCTQRIHPTDEGMKVEHWRSQARHRDQDLAWSNLLGACRGGEGTPRSQQRCDTRKADADIRLDPQDQTHLATLGCTGDGRLVSTDEALQEDIDVRLNLNVEWMVRERRARIQRFVAGLRSRYQGREFPAGLVRRTAESAAERDAEGRLPAFCCTLRLWAARRYGTRH